jgi:hypothetical protein
MASGEERRGEERRLTNFGGHCGEGGRVLEMRKG